MSLTKKQRGAGSILHFPTFQIMSNVFDTNLAVELHSCLSGVTDLREFVLYWQFQIKVRRMRHLAPATEQWIKVISQSSSQSVNYSDKRKCDHIMIEKM